MLIVGDKFFDFVDFLQNYIENVDFVALCLFGWNKTSLADNNNKNEESVVKQHLNKM